MWPDALCWICKKYESSDRDLYAKKHSNRKTIYTNEMTEHALYLHYFPLIDLVLLSNILDVVLNKNLSNFVSYF